MKTYRRKVRAPKPIGGGICEVELSKSRVALIDESDAWLIGRCSWCSTENGRNPHVYAKGRPPELLGRFVRMHRYLIGVDSALLCDHINGNTLDNRRCNLRLVTTSQNNMNQVVVQGRVKFKGVTFTNSGFTACICKDKRVRHLGTYATALEAALAYDAAAIEMFGEFSATNASLGLIESELVS